MQTPTLELINQTTAEMLEAIKRPDFHTAIKTHVGKSIKESNLIDDESMTLIYIDKFAIYTDLNPHYEVWIANDEAPLFESQNLDDVCQYIHTSLMEMYLSEFS